MYKIYDGEKTVCFDTYEQLLNALCRHNMRCGTEVWNNFLENVGTNPGDKRVRPGMNAYLQPADLYQPRTHRIYDADGHSLYDSLFVRDVLGWTYSEAIHQERLRSLGLGGPFRYYQKSAYPEFRRGPYPGTAKHSGHYPYYRDIRTFQERKLCDDPDLAAYCRKRRGKNLPDAYDDIPRNVHDRGWKRQSKCRYQWEHNIVSKSHRKHGKGIEVVPHKKTHRGGSFRPGTSVIHAPLAQLVRAGGS